MWQLFLLCAYRWNEKMFLNMARKKSAEDKTPSKSSLFRLHGQHIDFVHWISVGLCIEIFERVVYGCVQDSATIRTGWFSLVLYSLVIFWGFNSELDSKSQPSSIRKVIYSQNTSGGFLENQWSSQNREKHIHTSVVRVESVINSNLFIYSFIYFASSWLPAVDGAVAVCAYHIFIHISRPLKHCYAYYYCFPNRLESVF